MIQNLMDCCLDLDLSSCPSVDLAGSNYLNGKNRVGLGVHRHVFNVISIDLCVAGANPVQIVIAITVGIGDEIVVEGIRRIKVEAGEGSFATGSKRQPLGVHISRVVFASRILIIAISVVGIFIPAGKFFFLNDEVGVISSNREIRDISRNL